jgi:hypothetical protein
MGTCCSSNPQQQELEEIVTTSSIYETALHRSVRKGDLQSVKKLVKDEGSDVNAINGANQTPLIEACRNGKEDVAIYLIDHHEDVNPLLIDDSNRQAITYAAGNGMKDVCLKLLAYDGADVNGGAKDGASENSAPLWHAATEGHEDVVKFFLRQDTVSVDCYDINHWTPLFQATRMGHVGIVNLLLDAEADVTLAGLPDLEAPLHIAAVNGTQNQQLIAQLLIQKGKADVNAKNRLGYTPLIVATIKGHVNLVRILIENGGDANIALPQGETAGLTALHLACIKGYEDVVVALCEGGAIATCKDDDAQTPMMYAEQKGHISCMEALQAHTSSRF